MEVCVGTKKEEGWIRKLIWTILHKECKYGNNYNLICSFHRLLNSLN